MPDSESGYKWWIRNVLVPLIGGGGLVTLIVAYLNRSAPSVPDRATPSKAESSTTAPPPLANRELRPLHSKSTADSAAGNSDTDPSPPSAPTDDAIQSCKLLSDVPGLATFAVQYEYNALRPGSYAIRVNIYSTGTPKGPSGPGTTHLLSSAQSPVSRPTGTVVVDVEKFFPSGDVGFVEFQLLHDNKPLRVQQTHWNTGCI
jgi:hypothetical protein